MSLDDAQVWSEYANDAAEALAAIEGALLVLEEQPRRRDEIDRLYRGLHTIKGNSGFLRLVHIEHLAHATEDLIGLVRDHGVALDAELVDLVLVVVDRLRAVVEVAGERHVDARPEDVAELASAVEARLAALDPRRRPAPTVPAPPPPPVAAAIDDEPPVELIEPALDPGYVEIFLSLAADACPQLGAAIVDAADPEAGAAARATLARLGDELALAAERMGYVHLHAIATRVVAAADGGGDALAELPDLELALYAQLVGVEASLCELAPATASRAMTTIYERACAASAPADVAQLHALLESTAAPTLAHHDAVRARFARLRAACSHLGLAPSIDGLLEHEDRISRAYEQGEVPASGERAAALAFLTALAHAVVADDGSAPAVAAAAPDADERAAAAIPMSAALRNQITGTIAARVAAARGAGLALFELGAELERVPGLAAPFHAWLGAGAFEVLTSAVHNGVDHASAYRFLIAARQPIAALRAAARALAPDPAALWIHPLDGSEGPAPAVGASPPPTLAAPPPPPPPPTPIASADDEADEPVRAIKGDKAEFLRIDARKVSLIMELAGELGLASGAVTHHPELSGLELEGFAAASHKLEVLIRELQNEVSAMRLVPVAGVFQRMKRVVRDTARRTHKKVELVLVGEDTEIDKVMVDALADPLVHMLRNSIDHGIETPAERLAAGKPETGRIVLEASHQGGEVTVTVADDGRGLDRERIVARAIERGLVPATARPTDDDAYDLIFLPGFSTKQVIDELSGRGVGMDVVKSTIEGLRGRVAVRSTPGRGTQIQLAVPLTLAFVEAMIVGERDRLFAVPIEKVFEVFQVRAEQVATNSADGQRLLRVRDHVVPVCWLGRFFGDADLDDDLVGRIAVVVQTSHGSLALPIDRLLGNQQIMLKPLTGVLSSVRAAAGCGMLRSGDVALTLDCERLHA